MNAHLTAALELHAAGMSVIPIRTDGTKMPAGKWKHYQTSRATPEEIRAWFDTDNPPGLGVVTGTISGNLEMIEVESAAIRKLPELTDKATQSGMAELWTTVCTGWLEQSPTGGYHWFIRTQDPVPGNTKIARDKNKHVLAETRGEGGQTVIAPSNGTTHPTGKPWTRIAGSPKTVPVLTPEQREAFHALLGTLHEPPPEPPKQETLEPRTDIEGLTPGDDYEQKTDWKDILTGWTDLFTAGKTRHWRRPGKTIGISATTGHADDRDRLYVFTSSTVFEPETPYTKFGAYALLHHGGDHKTAASALRKKGYGDPLPLERPITLAPFTPTPPVAPLQATVGAATNDGPKPEKRAEKIPENIPATEGALATVHQLPVTVVESATDHGNSQLLIRRHGQRLRYTPQAGQWMTWDHTRWAPQPDQGPAVAATWETIQSIKDKDLAMHKQRSLSRRALEAAVTLAKYDPAIRVDADQLDAWPHELNTPTGIVDLRTGKLVPHDPGKLHTKLTGIGYQPEATAPLWEAFLATTFNGDKDMIAFVQRLAGYATTGEVTEHILPFLHGSGGNGKSVFLEVLISILGDYATTAPAGFLMAGREHHETEIARLAGARLVVCSEINLGAKFDEAKVKLLTGGDKLTARFMHQNHFTFTPSHTLFIMGNHQPRVSAGGESFWRRLRLIPFTHTVTDDEKIPGLANMLIDQEAPGILNWLVQGAKDVLTNGMREPAQVMAATHEYAEEEDALARFIEDKCTLGPASTFRVDTTVMRREYDQWCKEQGEQPLSPQQFGRDVKHRHNIEQVRSHGRRYYTGVTIFKNEPEPDEHWSNR